MHQPGTFFPSQRPNEKIVLFTRRHWIVLLTSFAAVLAGLLAYGATFLLVRYIVGGTFTGATYLAAITVSATALLMAWLVLYVKFIDYYLDVWILTDERIVQIKQRSLFNREIAEFDLSTVQDVSSKTQGVIGTFLNYGTIFVQTAAAQDLFIFRYIPNPNRVEQQIIELRERLEQQTKREIGMAAQTGTPIGDQHLDQLRRDLPDVK